MKRTNLALLLFLVFSSTCLQAAVVNQQWDWLAFDGPGSPFVGASPGPDLLWGTADDFADPGRNTPGYASYFRMFDGALTGYFGGTTNLDFDEVARTWTYNTYDGLTEISCAACAPPFFDQVSSFALTDSQGGSNTGQSIDVFEFEFSVDTISEDGAVARNNGVSVVLPRGFAPTDVTSNPDLIAHFNAVLPFLPADWSIVSISLDTFEFLTGDSAGATGVQSQTFVLSAVPVPPAIALLLVPIMALLRFGTRRH